MTNADWQAAARAVPDDATVRAAYADWLDDHGDPRAELLRLDLALFDRGDDPAADPLRARLAELAAAADVWWRMVFCRVPLDYRGRDFGADGAGEPFALPAWRLAGVCRCRGPAAVAPGLFPEPDGGPHVPVRQPRTPAQVWHLCQAAFACESVALRYTGRDPAVIGMVDNHPGYSDYLVREFPPGLVLSDGADARAARWPARPVGPADDDPDPDGVTRTAAAYDPDQPRHPVLARADAAVTLTGRVVGLGVLAGLILFTVVFAVVAVVGLVAFALGWR